MCFHNNFCITKNDIKVWNSSATGNILIFFRSVRMQLYFYLPGLRQCIQEFWWDLWDLQDSFIISFNSTWEAAFLLIFTKISYDIWAWKYTFHSLQTCRMKARDPLSEIMPGHGNMTKADVRCFTEIPEVKTDQIHSILADKDQPVRMPEAETLYKNKTLECHTSASWESCSVL